MSEEDIFKLHPLVTSYLASVVHLPFLKAKTSAGNEIRSESEWPDQMGIRK